MSIRYLQTMVAECAAYKVFERVPDGNGVVQISAKDLLGFKWNAFHWNQYRVCSVVSYALRNNQDPIAKVEKAKANGEELHWIAPKSSVLADCKQNQVDLVAVHEGMLVQFEGRLFTIETAPNKNLRFSPVKVAKKV